MLKLSITWICVKLDMSEYGRLLIMTYGSEYVAYRAQSFMFMLTFSNER